MNNVETINEITGSLQKIQEQNLYVQNEILPEIRRGNLSVEQEESIFERLKIAVGIAVNCTENMQSVLAERNKGKE